MTHPQHRYSAPASPDPGAQVIQLRHILSLVEEIAGRPPSPADATLEDAASLSSAYAEAWPIDRRRFDGLAAEIANWAAAGVEALLAAQNGERPPRAAAARLADELARALARLSTILPTNLQPTR